MNIEEMEDRLDKELKEFYELRLTPIIFMGFNIEAVLSVQR